MPALVTHLIPEPASLPIVNDALYHISLQGTATYSALLLPCSCRQQQSDDHTAMYNMTGH